MRDDRRGGSGGSGGSGGFRGGRSSGGSGGFRPTGPREMHKTTCADCGEETEVPFVPDPERPVYCRDCYQNHKPKKY